MIKNLVIVYSAGSCGDLVSIPWIATNHFYSLVSHHKILKSGRALAVMNEEFQNQFPKQPFKHQYARDWSQDIHKLSQLNQPFLILTTSGEQANLLKKYFDDDLHVLAIHYTKNDWSFVAKGFCTKILDYPGYLTNDDIGENFLNIVSNTPTQREEFLTLGKEGKLGYWYAQQLVNEKLSFPPKEFTYPGDSIITLDDILNFEKIKNKLESISEKLTITLDMENFSNVYESWYNQQFQQTEIDQIIK